MLRLLFTGPSVQQLGWFGQAAREAQRISQRDVFFPSHGLRLFVFFLVGLGGFLAILFDVS